MSYLVLARKWRPQRFDDVLGQRHVSLTLRNALTSDRLSHAYLFAGPRGVGKTSLARILAKALNCEQGPAAEPCNACAACRAITEGHCLDVLEIDGASNRGIDDVRQLRDSVKYAPASVRAKVYIIDEVHMLTTDAFNALLKTLEEPPPHVYFVLATTEPLKVPATILSRCQRHDFGRLTVEDLGGHLRRIAAEESLAIDDEALALLARKADGSVRDSLTLLDQVAATGAGPFRAADIQALIGLAGGALCLEISAAVTAGDGAQALRLIQRAHREGLNLQELTDELVAHFRNLMLLSLDPELGEAVESTGEERALLAEQASAVRPGDALRWLRLLLDAAAAMRRSGHGRVHLELALAEMAALPRAVDLATLLAHLRSAPAGGASAAAPGSETPARAPGAPAGPRARPASGRAQGPGGGGTALAAPPAIPGEQGAGEGSAASGITVVPLGTPEADELLRTWGQVVERLRRERAFLGSCLHSSRPMCIEQGRLLVALDDTNGFKSEQIEKPANRRLILRLIEESYHQALGLRLVRGPRAGAAAGADAAVAPAEPALPPAAAAPPGSAAGAGAVRESPPVAEDAVDGRARVRRIAELLDGDIIGPSR
ncbi:MAG: DNA polymerase III subunit gamma/tau [Candidatus Eisenbacteria bacterium]|uniref:DNA polymerase III subunit gamma/tau n=1 Tax=Eiseniibacteriota bacterium TaxID=2212470 RepID=A0A937XCD5_UNCEI|nr:DNA polymerase III subunit gamma/tau [Candidatus Eisenbacteria bacterium]